MKKSLLTFLILGGLAGSSSVQANWLTVGLGSVGALVSARLYRGSVSEYYYLTVSIPFAGEASKELLLSDVICAMIEGKASTESISFLSALDAEYLLKNSLIEKEDGNIVGWKIIEETDSCFHFGAKKVALLCKNRRSGLSSMMYGAATLASLGLVGYSLYNR